MVNGSRTVLWLADIDIGFGPNGASALSMRIESPSFCVLVVRETVGVDRIGRSEPISQSSARGHHRGQGLVSVSVLVYIDKWPK